MMVVVSFPSVIPRSWVNGARGGGRACELAWTTAVLAGLLSLPACGGGSGGGGASGSSAFDLPTIVSSGGPVLDSPRVQPIYFPGFAFQTDVDGFLAKMAGSSYWPTVVKEYGVGDLTIMPSLVTSVSSGAALADTDIPGLLAQVFTSSGGALGTPSRDTIYLLLFPSSTTITAQGQVMCGASAPSGYHTEFSLGGVTVPGVVVPSCPNYAGDTTLTGVQALTPTISHEIVESATDPFTTTAPAYFDVDERHTIWSVAINGGEVADLCENETPDLITPDDIGYPVQRIWSNDAANAGTGPCVPVPAGEVFFIAVPTLPNQVPVSYNGKQFSVPALNATVGTAVSVQVSMRSERNVVEQWVVGALEFHSDNASVPQAPPLTGQTGQTLRVSVVPNTVASGLFPLIIASATSNAVHFWVGAINRK
jgi:hypothetical protein